jgi:hypothetical protein
METIKLRDVGGMGLMSGWDDDGRHRVEWIVDNGDASNGLLACSVCGEPLSVRRVGWVCPENGEVRCSTHVAY